eukprot:366055-Chlamydomonas_euryale.AAC.1
MATGLECVCARNGGRPHAPHESAHQPASLQPPGSQRPGAASGHQGAHRPTQLGSPGLALLPAIRAPTDPPNL